MTLSEAIFRRGAAKTALVCAVFAALSMNTACSAFKNKNKEASRKDEPTESADALFAKGEQFLKDGDYKKAVQAFKDLDTVYPYSDQAVKGEVLSAYASYNAEEYDDAADMLDKYIKFHPGGDDAAYAYYLKALSYYDRISDIGRDQGVTNMARGALLDVVRRFPDSDYARDAKLKLDLVNDHLAGKEVAIGIFYQKQMKPVAAINRFRNVLERFETTTHAQEALYRLTESYISIGVLEEARKYAALLGYNYPNSKWYRYAYDLLKKKAPEALRDSPVPGQEEANPQKADEVKADAEATSPPESAPPSAEADQAAKSQAAEPTATPSESAPPPSPDAASETPSGLSAAAQSESDTDLTGGLGGASAPKEPVLGGGIEDEPAAKSPSSLLGGAGF